AGAFTSTTAGLIRTQGTRSISIGAAFTGSLEINSGTTNVAGTAGGSVTILSGAVMNITNQTVTVNGDLTIGGSLISSSSNGTFNAAGANVVNNGSVTGIAFRFSGTSQNLSGTGSISSGVTIFSGSTVTLGSDHQLATLVVNTGGTLNTAAFTLSLNGSGTPLSGAGTIANVNITYNGTAAQTVQATNVTYNRVGINNAAGVTLSTAETVNQRLLLLNGQFNNGVNLSLAAGATIERNNGTLQTAPTLLGNVNLVYSGSAVVTTGIEFPTSTTVVNDLSVTKVGAANTVTLDASRTVNGALTLTTGRLLTGAFNIIIGPVGTASGTANGYVIGSIRKTVAGPGSTVYPVGTAAGYSPATINIDSGSGSFTVTAANGVIGGLAAAKALNRYWSLSQSGITHADITFAYQQSDVPGPANEPGFDFFRDGGGGTFFDPSSLDTGNNIATLNNVTQFSDWTLYDPTPNPDTTVSSTADAGPGTLRQAILDANALAGADTIVFNGTFGSAQTILLTSGEMLVSDELTITGPGANLLTISGGNSSRIFSIASGETATFSGFRMTAGNGIGGTDAGSGGAIYSLGNLDLTNVAIDANTASVSGGGIFSSGGTLDVTGSTISRNSAVADGGGIHINSTTATVHNSTISGNSATASGGGINIVSGPVTITYSTIANNGAGVNGGGVNGASTAGNTIIADNTATGSGPDYNGTLTSQGHMLLGNTSGATIAGTTTGNITAAPQLDQLTNNGGPTETHRLQLTSPAVDAADPITFPPTDQRGMPRPVDGNATGGARADIGAFELMITTAADVIISGRILASNGRPISGALVELNSAKGEPLSARTNTFGYFRFKEVEVGESYVMTVSARGFNFAPLFLSVNDNIDGLIITPTGRR
ncbi:MAG: carboxypeptidase-like regulatory domain-containing protein, partial [bacterium]|nr:carboxypeptidase-like regulatory domain-containing protein [bacterium]